MHSEEYITFIEDFLTEEVNLDLSPNLIKKLAVHSKILEKETDFTLDDIVEELSNIIPAKQKEDSDLEYFLSELANLILDEIELQASEEEVDEYYEEGEEE